MQLVRGVDLLCCVHFADPIILALKPTHTHQQPCTLQSGDAIRTGATAPGHNKHGEKRNCTLGAVELSYDVVPQ